MTVSRQPQITEELLSAYLDDQVTAEERALVEAAIATDPAIAWQVDSLRQTVQMLQALPPLTLPRTFTLEAILAEARTAEASAPLQADVAVPTNHAPRRPVVRTPVAEAPKTPWWQGFYQLWQGGNLQLRNAAAVALTLFFVLFAGDRFLVTTRPLPEVTPAAAPVVATSLEHAAAEPPLAPTAAEPTATSAPTDVAVAAAVNSNDPATGGTADNVAAVNTLASPAAQPENNTRQSEGAAFAAPGGAPGPVEEDLTGGSGSIADAPAAQTFRATESGERSMAATTALISDAITATTTATQEYAIAAKPPLTTTVLAALLSATVTNTTVISVTPTVTPTATITQTVLPTVTMASAAPLTTLPPTVDEEGAWLNWAQMITALSTVVLAGLWWRSRR